MNYKKMTSKLTSIALFFVPVIFMCLNVGCESPSLKANNAAANKKIESRANDFESDLQTMKTAGFDYIFVFRRKDGGVFDDEDKQYLRANRPPQANRFISADDDKAFIAGSSFEFPPANLEALRKRFNIEDYSTPKQTNQNSVQSNSAKN